MSNASSITDSPWYWVYLFCTAALIALIMMGPKFTARQAQIERKMSARQAAARRVSGQTDHPPAPSPEGTTITLTPLYVILGIILIAAWFHLWKRSRPRPNAQGDDPP